ncbi:MAG: hypothetical protein KatS3mg115_1855 [Candidatus Poribacteria bacterium]|nr:MAG: hypothetical protein KatS3mg115_1855 [Candidatus Poribacteria bacterium]
MNEAIIRETVVMILAGGQGERLYPLTRHRAKPAVPFAGAYRIIDFTLSNCINSTLTRIFLLTQYPLRFASSPCPGRLELLCRSGAGPVH